jgi:hypothetical protein
VNLHVAAKHLLAAPRIATFVILVILVILAILVARKRAVACCPSSSIATWDATWAAVTTVAVTTVAMTTVAVTLADRIAAIAADVARFVPAKILATAAVTHVRRKAAVFLTSFSVALGAASLVVTGIAAATTDATLAATAAAVDTILAPVSRIPAVHLSRPVVAKLL